MILVVLIPAGRPCLTGNRVHILSFSFPFPFLSPPINPILLPNYWLSQPPSLPPTARKSSSLSHCLLYFFTFHCHLYFLPLQLPPLFSSPSTSFFIFFLSYFLLYLLPLPASFIFFLFHCQLIVFPLPLPPLFSSSASTLSTVLQHYLNPLQPLTSS